MISAPSKVESNQGAALVFLFLAVGLGVLFLTRRQSNIIDAEPLFLEKPGKVKSITPIHVSKAETRGLLHYKNKETRDIEWNEDGLPKRIIIEREYYQLP